MKAGTRIILFTGLLDYELMSLLDYGDTSLTACERLERLEMGPFTFFSLSIANHRLLITDHSFLIRHPVICKKETTSNGDK